jgi:SAM-dependent methyltransferase
MQVKSGLGRVKNKEKLPDFGTYHHTTPKDSAKIRGKVKLAFVEAFRTLPFAKHEKLEVLDLGCGLGFVSCVCAGFYPNAIVTGIDTFEDASLKGSNLAKARKNAEILGFSDRVTFQKGDIFRSNYKRSGFDLFVSNLVYHNFGDKRFAAYERLASWVRPNSYVILGDMMFHPAVDLKYLSRLFKNVNEIATALGGNYLTLVLSAPK